MVGRGRRETFCGTPIPSKLKYRILSELEYVFTLEPNGVYVYHIPRSSKKRRMLARTTGFNKWKLFYVGVLPDILLLSSLSVLVYKCPDEKGVKILWHEQRKTRSMEKCPSKFCCHVMYGCSWRD